MKSGSKYYPLFQHLQNCREEEVTLTCAKIESIMGCALPATARKRKNWWSNRDSASALQAGAWIQASYRVASVDLEQQTITFQRFQSTYNIQRQNGNIKWTSESIRALRCHKGFNQEEFAEELGVRRETVSEWENSKYEPDRSKQKLLNFIAREANFK